MNQLTHTPEHGHIWNTTCTKCGTHQKVRIGDCTVAQAAESVEKLDNTPMECPGGYHTELGGWRTRWNLDAMLAELQRKEDAANEAAIGNDLQKCDLIEALGDDKAKAAAATHREQCFAEIREMNERDGLNTGQTDEELLAELAEPQPEPPSISEIIHPKSEITMPRFNAINPTETPQPVSFPRALAIRLMAQPHENQVGPLGDHNAEFRRDVLEKLTGKRPPKAKAGIGLVSAALAAHYRITDSTCGADHDNQIRDGLRRTIFAEFANTAPAFQQELRDISTIGGESIEKIYTLWCVYVHCSYDQSSLLSEFKEQHAFDLGLNRDGTARERHTASPTPPPVPTAKRKAPAATPQGDLIRRIPAATFAAMSGRDGEGERTAFARWVDEHKHTGDWRSLWKTYHVSLTCPAAETPPPQASSEPPAEDSAPPANIIAFPAAELSPLQQRIAEMRKRSGL